LSANQIIVLKAIYKYWKSKEFVENTVMPTREWSKKISEIIGHNVNYLVEKEIEHLEGVNLIFRHGSRSGFVQNAGLSDYGILFMKAMLEGYIN
jgi:hypothetical protein